MSTPMTDKCPACRVEFAKHAGIIRLCHDIRHLNYLLNISRTALRNICEGFPGPERNIAETALAKIAPCPESEFPPNVD